VLSDLPSDSSRHSWGAGRNGSKEGSGSMGGLGMSLWSTFPLCLEQFHNDEL